MVLYIRHQNKDVSDDTYKIIYIIFFMKNQFNYCRKSDYKF